MVKRSKLSDEIATIKIAIADEQHRLRAAQNIIASGRGKLDEALVEKSMKKTVSVAFEAKQLMDIGSEKYQEIEKNIRELEHQLSILITKKPK